MPPIPTGINMSPSSPKNSDILPDNLIPEKYLNSMNFINYNAYGKFPWVEGVVVLPPWFKSLTKYLAIDCEMVGVGELDDSELARVSIVNEFGYCVYDSFAKPEKEVSSYRTKISGIRPEDLQNAPSVDEVVKRVAAIVTNRVLIGHSILHDLKVLRLMDHPNVRDTSEFYRFLSGGSFRFPLKRLAKQCLGVDIQSGEHSSVQDAQATMKLYLVRRNQWEKFQKHFADESRLVNIYGNINIKDIKICPSINDLHLDSERVYIRPNKIDEPYSSSEEYKDVQFRLLLEDFLRPMRDGVRIVNTNVKNGRNNKRVDRLYRDVIVRIRPDNNGIVLDIPIERNKLRDIEWNHARRFMNGSLLILSRDNFQKDVKFAEITYFVESSTASTSHCIRLHVAIIDGENLILKTTDRFQVMESKAFYAAYKYTLTYLQSVDLETFPMKKYIVDCKTTPGIPEYLRRNRIAQLDFSVLLTPTPPPEPRYYLRSIVNLVSPHHVVATNVKANPLDFRSWPSADLLGLDASQYEGLQRALTQEFSIIQGPPGCGKTFMAIQIVKILLTNPWMLEGRPVMVVSYTNHALDQTLERIFEFMKTTLTDGNEKEARLKILRLGGMSESETVKRFSLIEKLERHAQYTKCNNQMEVLRRSMNSSKLVHQLLKTDNYLLKNGILRLESLPYELINRLNHIKNVETSRLLKLMSQPNFSARAATFFGLENDLIGTPITNARLFHFSFKGLTVMEEILTNLDKFINIDHTNDWWNMEAPSSPKLFGTRWSVYLMTLQIFKGILDQIELEERILRNKLEELGPTQTKKEALKAATVVGMTTTGAVKFKSTVLNHLMPKIVIVEEAAHVIEAHVVCSLTQHVEQLIMIGDHMQLRPITADYEMSLRYNLDVSFMERLVRHGIKNKEQNWTQLMNQHRMRPEIARMVCPVIYRNLNNHPDVLKYPKVKGCRKNIFFVNHNVSEEKEDGSKSWINKHEINFVVGLTKYFGKHYGSSRITVIATYKAQRDWIENRLKDEGITDVRISTVDGYQGEENDIVILSLVRSNDEDYVGFLKKDNRVCVALSRARHGLFAIGNVDCLARASDTWETIQTTLRDMNSLGSADDFHKMLTAAGKDFIKKLPLVQVPKRCKYEAEPFDALETIDKFANLTLNEETGPIDYSIVNKDSFKVSPSESPFKNQRQSLVEVSNSFNELNKENVPTLLDRNRFSSNPPHKPKPKSNLVKTAKLILPVATISKMAVNELVFPCGHRVARKQGENLSKLKCKEIVSKSCNCGERSKEACCSETVIFNCKKLTDRLLPCGHHIRANCNKSISKIKCTTVVQKKLPCNHTASFHCHLDPKEFKCNIQMEKTLKCGHTAVIRCRDMNSTDNTQCKKGTVEFTFPTCKHEHVFPCTQFSKNPSLTKLCTAVMKVILPCGHYQNVSCHQIPKLTLITCRSCLA